MAENNEKKPLKVFISYTRTKDEMGVVSNFRTHLKNEINLIETGASIFQDKNDIKPGDLIWKKIEEEIKDSEVLIVLLSPAWIESSYCRWEFKKFLKKEQNPESRYEVNSTKEILTIKEEEENLSIEQKNKDGQIPRILPILWVDTNLNNKNYENDQIVSVLKEIQYANDWIKIRHKIQQFDAIASEKFAELADCVIKLTKHEEPIK